jgi:hypothetical protein
MSPNIEKMLHSIRKNIGTRCLVKHMRSSSPSQIEEDARTVGGLCSGSQVFDVEFNYVQLTERTRILTQEMYGNVCDSVCRGFSCC